MKNIYIKRIDHIIMNVMRRYSSIIARASLFIIFFWFGILKIVGTSAANEIVALLQVKTLPFFATNQFIVFLGGLEVIIAFLILIPRWERLSFGLLFIHMSTTFLPLILLSDITWKGFLIPTLEGQYIIKNIVIIAMAMVIVVYISPLHTKIK